MPPKLELDTWSGDRRFARCVTSDGFDLRVGLMRDGRTFGWIVYRTETMARVSWGDGAPSLEQARAEAVEAVAVERAEARRELRRMRRAG